MISVPVSVHYWCCPQSFAWRDVRTECCLSHCFATVDVRTDMISPCGVHFPRSSVRGAPRVTVPDMHLLPGIQRTPECLYMAFSTYSASNTTIAYHTACLPTSWPVFQNDNFFPNNNCSVWPHVIKYVSLL